MRCRASRWLKSGASTAIDEPCTAFYEVIAPGGPVFQSLEPLAPGRATDLGGRNRAFCRAWRAADTRDQLADCGRQLLNALTDLALPYTKEQTHHVLGRIGFGVEQDEKQLKFRTPQTAFSSATRLAVGGLSQLGLAARPMEHATPKQRAKSSNSNTVMLVVARISRSERLACSNEIMLSRVYRKIASITNHL